MERRSKDVKRTGVQVMLKLIGLVKPLIGVMLFAVILGVSGFLCAIFLNVFGVTALVNVLGFHTGISLKSIFVWIVIFGVLRGVLHYGEQLCNHYIAFHILALIRDKIFGALRRLAPARLESKDKGNLISIITSDIELLEVFYAHTISPIIIAIITSVIMLVFFATLSPVMCVVAACGYLLVGLFMPMLVSKMGRKIGSEYRNEFGDFDSFFLDSLRGLRETIQFGQQYERLKEIGSRTRSLSVKQKKMKMYSGISIALTGCIVSGFSLIILFTGIHLYEAGDISFKEVLVGTVAMMSSFGPVIALSGLANNLLHTFASGNRVLDILEEAPVVNEVTEGINNISKDDINIEVQNVNFSYDKEDVIKNMNVRFDKNHIIGINGPSGCGKSTLLKLLMRFWDTDSGRITIGNNDVKQLNTHCLRETESFVTQDTRLFNDTIENNIKLAKKDATYEEVVEAAKAASLHDFIMSLEQGYETNVGELGDRLSGGERQRIGIARAFLHQAPVILLDEPTSNLDSLNEGIILKSLDARRIDKCIIIVSHRKSTMGIADIVYKMENGKIV
ncbi:MAG: ABC transporter ATP-binding protein [Clostridiales bacterium]|nr:ABC transporter ATP-binding protein [Clostridiales bacterium]